MRERKDLLRRNKVKKGKILGLLLAARLATASVPAAVFASESNILIPPGLSGVYYNDAWLSSLKTALTGLTAASSIQDLANKTNVSNDDYKATNRVLTYVFSDEDSATNWAAFKNTSQCSLYGDILQSSSIARIDIFLAPTGKYSSNYTAVAEFIAYVAQFRPTRVILRNTYTAASAVTTLALESASQFSQVSFVVESGATLS
jgi:hypothetical protein